MANANAFSGGVWAEDFLGIVFKLSYPFQLTFSDKCFLGVYEDPLHVSVIILHIERNTDICAQN